ncbi:major facilitator superfamily transporter [Xylariales sp. AK1849]|nr:major facilitator superfamily transporter [Xylariales sp. AK1849]
MSDSKPQSNYDARDNAVTNEPQGAPNPPPRAEFKEGGYGWVVVLATALLNCHTWGLNSAFAVFLAYYLRNNILEGATPLGFAFTGCISISISLLISPVATILAGLKGFGARKTILLGTVFETIGFIGASFTTELWHLLLSQGVAFGVGMGLIFVASVPIPSQWFNKQRSLANACAAAGSGFGGLIYSLGTNAMISSIGLAWTFRVIAIICFVVNTTCSFLIRDRNQAVGSIHIAFNWQLFKRPSYLLFLGWMTLSMIPYVALVFSIVDYCQAIGLSSSQASLVGALLNLSQGLGRPLIGLSSDSVGRINIAGFCTLLCGILCVTLWVFAKTLASCIVFALLVGAVAGVMWATAAPVLTEVIGLPLLPSGLSMSWLVLVLPATFAEVIALELRNREYRAAQLFIGFMYIAAFVSIWTLRAWKVRELERAHLDKEQRESAIRDDAVVSGESPQQAAVETGSMNRQRFTSMKGLWAIQRV